MYKILILAICILLSSKTNACELMGFSFNKETSAQNLFSTFRTHGNANPDGWGVAFYSDKSVTLFKEHKNAAESKLAKFLESYPLLKSKLFIAHVRKASVGGSMHQNTHPFVRELNGKEYVLAHNGTLRNYLGKLNTGRIKPLGKNDSEFLLCYILGQIEKNKIDKWDKKSFGWLQTKLKKINDFGTLNCIFSDGDYLFVYCDKTGYKTLCLSKSEKGVVIARNPLTKEKWKKMEKGKLLVFKNGGKVF